jgi:uncharacterized protein YjiS (DUF1127 family)
VLRRNIGTFAGADPGLCSRHETTGESSPALKGLTTMFLSNLIGVFRQWRRYNESLRELNRLGDRELADIGLRRGDIPRAAWENSENF